MDDYLNEFFNNYPANAEGQDFEGFDRDPGVVPMDLEAAFERHGGNSIFSSIPNSLHTIDDWSIDQDKYNTNLRIYNHLNLSLANKFNVIDSALKVEPLTDSSIEVLEEHKSWLESQKSFLGKKSGKIIDIMSNIKTESQYFELFVSLETKFTDLEQKLIFFTNKIKKKITSYHKDQDVSHRDRLSLPKFTGCFVEFKRFKTQFSNFCKGLGSEDKKMHLTNALEATPKAVIEPLLNADQDFDKIWKALVEHFSNPKEITDSCISDYLNQPTPIDSMAALGKHFITMRNHAANILNLNLDLEEFLCHMYLLKIPGSFRSDLETHLPKDKHKFKFEDIAPFVNNNVRVKRYKHEVVAALAPMQTNYQVTATPGIVQGGKTGSTFSSNPTNATGAIPKDRKRSSQYLICYICKSPGHKAGKCRAFTWGPGMRAKLQELGRCDCCLLPEKEHKATCRPLHNYSCNQCNQHGHINITCDGKPHPGSWVIKSYQTNTPNPSI